MSRTTNRINDGMTRLAFWGGTAVFASSIIGSFIELFIPLAVTLIGSLIIGLLIRGIFVRMLNKRLFSEYRYTDTNANTNANKKSTRSRTNNAQSETTSNKEINHEETFAPVDSLSLYRNLLELGPRFTADELKTAYRNGAAMYHPDRYASASPSERQTAEDLMKKVNEAYERLKPAAL
jgi:hypothetical protein